MEGKMKLKVWGGLLFIKGKQVRTIKEFDEFLKEVRECLVILEDGNPWIESYDLRGCLVNAKTRGSEREEIDEIIRGLEKIKTVMQITLSLGAVKTLDKTIHLLTQKK